MCYNKYVLNDMIGVVEIMFGSTKIILMEVLHDAGYSKMVQCRERLWVYSRR